MCSMKEVGRVIITITKPNMDHPPNSIISIQPFTQTQQFNELILIMNIIKSKLLRVNI